MGVTWTLIAFSHPHIAVGPWPTLATLRCVGHPYSSGQAVKHAADALVRHVEYNTTLKVRWQYYINDNDVNVRHILRYQMKVYATLHNSHHRKGNEQSRDHRSIIISI